MLYVCIRVCVVCVCVCAGVLNVHGTLDQFHDVSSQVEVISANKLRFTYNSGDDVQELNVTRWGVSDGAWHQVTSWRCDVTDVTAYRVFTWKHPLPERNSFPLQAKLPLVTAHASEHFTHLPPIPT